MISLFSKIKHTIINTFNQRRSLYNYPRDYYYASLMTKYNGGQFYIDLLKRIRQLEPLKSITPITFIRGKDINNLKVKDILKKYGRPTYNFSFQRLPDIKILFYKIKLGKYKINLELHFFNDFLFLYTYNFMNIKSKDKNEIINILKDKYLVEGEFDQTANYIEDPDHNLIILNNDFDPAINYICDKNRVLSSITDYVEQAKERHLKRKAISKQILYKHL